MSRYVVNILASQDLNEIANYFAETNLEAGERFFRKFNRKCQQLVAFPNSGKSYSQIRTDLRGLQVESYIIFYRILDDGIEILRVVSGRRDLPSLFELTRILFLPYPKLLCSICNLATVYSN